MPHTDGKRTVALLIIAFGGGEFIALLGVLNTAVHLPDKGGGRQQVEWVSLRTQSGKVF